MKCFLFGELVISSQILLFLLIEVEHVVSVRVAAGHRSRPEFFHEENLVSQRRDAACDVNKVKQKSERRLWKVGMQNTKLRLLINQCKFELTFEITEKIILNLV